MKDEREPGKPGADAQRVKLDLPFEEAARQALQTPKPEEGFPDFRVRERKSPERKGKEGGNG